MASWDGGDTDIGAAAGLAAMTAELVEAAGKLRPAAWLVSALFSYFVKTEVLTTTEGFKNGYMEGSKEERWKYPVKMNVLFKINLI